MTEVVVKDYENDLRDIIGKSVDKVIGNQKYDEKAAQGWVKEICSEITNQCLNANFPFKVVANGFIMKAGKAGFNNNTKMYWDPTHDGSVVFKEERKDDLMHYVFTVYGVTD